MHLFTKSLSCKQKNISLVKKVHQVWEDMMKKISVTLLIVFLFTMAYSVKPAYACECEGVGTPGYWKNHPEAWPVDRIDIWVNNQIVASYTKAQALEWLNSSVRNDKSITMFKAVVAATLNRLNYCGCADIEDWIWYGHQWLSKYPVGSDVPASSYAWQWGEFKGERIYWMLDQYNNGWLCQPPRD
jgi:hypothetical protein